MSDWADFPKLRAQDVSRLLNDPSDVNRARVARKLGVSIDSDTLSLSERAMAEEVIRMFARDAVVHVRIALAESVKSASTLPRDIALKLAQDVAEVAVPIVRFSHSLTDEDLIDIVRGGDTLYQRAVAIRDSVSPIVVETLINHGDQEAVVALLRNDGAEVDRARLNLALERFGDVQEIPDAMARREQLPPAIAARMVTLVSESVQAHLINRFKLTPALAQDLLAKSRDRAVKTLYASNTTSADPFLRAREMAATRRLSSRTVLQALCRGDVSFFEASLAVMANIPLSNARVLMHDTGPLGLKSLLEKADIPSRLIPIFRVALAVAKELDTNLDDEGYLDGRRAIAARIIDTFADSRHADIDQLLAKFDDFATTRERTDEVARQNA